MRFDRKLAVRWGAILLLFLLADAVMFGAWWLNGYVVRYWVRYWGCR